MARLQLSDLPQAIREQVIAQHGLQPTGLQPTWLDAKKMKSRQIGVAPSPYADCLGEALDARFPGRMLREYQLGEKP